MPDQKPWEKYAAKKQTSPDTGDGKPGAISRFGSSAAKALLPSTTASDYAYPLEHPITTVENIPGVLKEMVAGPYRELTAKSDNWQDAALHGLKAVPIIGQNIVEAGEQFNEGDVAGGLGTVAGTAAGIEAPEVAEEGLSKVGRLREMARGQAQRMLGAGPGAVIRPMVKEYGKNLAATETANRAETERAFGEAGDRTAAYNRKVDAAKQAAEEATKKSVEEAAKKTGEKQSAHEQSAAQQAEYEKQRQSLKQGSAALGQSLEDLEGKIHEEVNEKYAPVHAATKNDPGLPAGSLAEDVRHAEQNILKGSTENIKQFRQIVGDAEEGGGIETSYGTVKPGTRAYDRLVAQGAADMGDAMPFDELQGYSSEIGSKLAGGELPGDVYQALKYVKDKLDAAKATIAERNGVGDALKEADKFNTYYQDTFYGRSGNRGAVAETLSNVRGTKLRPKVDPEFYAEPFTKGKASQTGIDALRRMPTKHSAEATKVADLADQLKQTTAKLTKPKAVEAPTPIEAKTVAPKEVPKPREVEAKYKEPPTAPTAESIRQDRAEKLRNLGERPRTFMLGSGIMGFLTGHPGIGSTGLAGWAVINRVLESDAVVNVLSKPTTGDLKFIKDMPEPARQALAADLKEAINRGKGSKISPEFLRAAGVTSVGVPKNRKEAMDRLQSVSSE